MFQSHHKYVTFTGRGKNFSGSGWAKGTTIQCLLIFLQCHPDFFIVFVFAAAIS